MPKTHNFTQRNCLITLIDLHEMSPWVRQGILAAIDKTKHRVIMTPEMAVRVRLVDDLETTTIDPFL